MTTSSKQLAPRILVAEDEEAIAEICQRVLASEGFEVDVAGNGRVAQAMICERRYDLYLIDIKMPVMGGRGLYKWMQEAYPRSADEVVFTTGSAENQDTESFLQRSGRPVLLKPFTPAQLKDVVKACLGKG